MKVCGESSTWLTLKVNKLLLMSVALTLLVVSPVVRTTNAQGRSATSSATRALSDWKRYTVKDEEFSVLLPVMPAMNTFDRYIDKFDKDQRQRILGAYADGVVYAIYTFENPKRRQSLDEVISESHTSETGHDIKRNGFQGKEFSFRTADLKGISQYYITEHQIYLFRATGSTLGNPEVGIPKFFSSLKLTNKPQGVAVVDGLGEQPTAVPSSLDNPNATRVLTGKEVTVKARVMTKPEPRYTEEARRNQIEGTVVLRAVFSSSGGVTNIRAISGVPYGLTERAIGAARQLRFIPAIKDGYFVSMYIQLEYNFNLY